MASALFTSLLLTLRFVFLVVQFFARAGDYQRYRT
jgi:hypothetical protein